MGFSLTIPFIVNSCSKIISNYGNIIYVEEIIDGDTFSANNEVHRIIGIDTPETFNVQQNEPTNGPQNFWGTIAKNETKKLLLNKSIEVESLKKDKYNRWISRITLENGIDFSSYLISQGYAIMRYISPNPNNVFYYYDSSYIEQLNDLQKEAQNNKRGFWKENNDTFKKIYPNL